MPEKAHAHRGWPPMVTNNAHAICKHKKHTKNKHKIQSVCKYLSATRIQHTVSQIYSLKK